MPEKPSNMGIYVTIAVGLASASLLMTDAVIHCVNIVSTYQSPTLHHVLMIPVTAAIGIALVSTAKNMFDEMTG